MANSMVQSSLALKDMTETAASFVENVSLWEILVDNMFLNIHIK